MTFDYAKRDDVAGGIYALAIKGWETLPPAERQKINVAELFCRWAEMFGHPLDPRNLRNISSEQSKKPGTLSFLVRNVQNCEKV